MIKEAGFLARADLQTLLDRLHDLGYRVIGPVVDDAAILYRDIDRVEQLPLGYTDDQAPGSYRLSQVDTPRCFAWADGPHALKPFLFAPRETMWQVARDSDGRLAFSAVDPVMLMKSRRSAATGLPVSSLPPATSVSCSVSPSDTTSNFAC